MVPFGDDPKAHVLVEFSFDVAQIIASGYEPETYHRFIGFRIAKQLLERAFQNVYGVEMKKICLSEDLAIGTYRRGASEIIPQMTQIAWKERRADIIKLKPGLTKKKFVYRLSRSNYEKEWGNKYQRRRGFGNWGQNQAQEEGHPSILARAL